MTVESLEFTDEGWLDALTKRMLQLRDEISWLDDGQAGTDDPESCRYFGNMFEIGRHVRWISIAIFEKRCYSKLIGINNFIADAEKPP